MRVRIEDCDDAAFAKIVPLLRAEDIEEWRLFAGETPEVLIRSGFKLPVGAGALNRIGYGPSGRPLVVWGVSPFTQATGGSHFTKDWKVAPNAPGWVWLVATREAHEHAKSIHHHLKHEFHETICQMYPRLVTASYEGNPAHHLWLRWLGFKQAFVTMPMGARSAPFIPFSYERKDHA